MSIIVRPRHLVETGRVVGNSLISIAGHNGPFPKLGDCWSNRLDLRFDDVPVAEAKMIDGVWRGPTRNDLESALEYARSASSPLVVHCEQGKSRSAGVALAILADRCGAGNEEEAVEQLMLATLTRETAQPNPLLVIMADKILERDGRIWHALAEKCPNFVSWVGYWQNLGIF